MSNIDKKGSPNVPGWVIEGVIDVTGQTSVTFTLSQSYDWVFILTPGSFGDVGFNQLQVNGDTGANYDYTENDGTETTGASAWGIENGYSREYILIKAFESSTGFTGVSIAHGSTRSLTDNTVSGENTNVTPPLNSFTLVDSNGNSNGTYAVVYGLNL